jgi:hypothetical protein
MFCVPVGESIPAPSQPKQGTSRSPEARRAAAIAARPTLPPACEPAIQTGATAKSKAVLGLLGAKQVKLQGQLFASYAAWEGKRRVAYCPPTAMKEKPESFGAPAGVVVKTTQSC